MAARAKVGVRILRPDNLLYAGFAVSVAAAATVALVVSPELLNLPKLILGKESIDIFLLKASMRPPLGANELSLVKTVLAVGYAGLSVSTVGLIGLLRGDPKRT